MVRANATWLAAWSTRRTRSTEWTRGCPNTRPGYISGPGAREAAGLAPQGPNIVVSTVGVIGYDTPDGGRTGSCEMRLREVYPGVDPESVAAIAPWTVQPGEPIETCPPATEEEIAALRAVDPAAAARPSPLVHGLLSPPGAAASST